MIVYSEGVFQVYHRVSIVSMHPIRVQEVNSGLVDGGTRRSFSAEG